MVITRTGNFFDGESVRLTCVVSLPEDFRVNTVVEWVGPRGIIENGAVEDLSLNILTPSLNSPIITHQLRFSPLRSMHNGIYTCRASVIDPVANLSIDSSSSETVMARCKKIYCRIAGEITWLYIMKIISYFFPCNFSVYAARGNVEIESSGNKMSYLVLLYFICTFGSIFSYFFFLINN